MTERSDDKIAVLIRQALKDDSPVAEQIRWHISYYLKAHLAADRDGMALHRQQAEALLAQYRCLSCGS
jgi:hypothetical protein